MKRILCILLVLLVLPLYGCQERPVTKEAKIHITAENYYLDFYGSGLLDFYIYSTTQLDAENIQVQIPTQNSYELFIYTLDVSPKKAVDGTGGWMDFPFYLCDTNAAVDWQTLGQLRVSNPTAFAQQEKVLMESFRQMPLEDIPAIYLYQVQVIFSWIQEKETISYMEIIIGETTYHQQIGQLRLDPQPMVTADNEKVLDAAAYTTEYVQKPWISGKNLSFLWEWIAQTDMTLTGLSLLQENVLDNFVVTVYNHTTGEILDWDMQTPINIEVGQQVKVSVSFMDQRMDAFHGAYHYYGILEFETDEGMFQTVARKTVYKKPCIYDVYATAFENVDLEDYYRYYCE